MITIKLFAILKDRIGRDEVKIKAANGTVADLLQQVSREYPALSDMLAPGRIVVSVNHEFVKQDAPVRDGDEVALMPPFSGGAIPRLGTTVYTLPPGGKRLPAREDARVSSSGRSRYSESLRLLPEGAPLKRKSQIRKIKSQISSKFQRAMFETFDRSRSAIIL
jgi:molybdopterin synthase sulfur carrier subunit